MIARGYHGTTLEAATKIVTELNFEQENHDWHWLGYGIYFWQDAPLRAWQWAQNRALRDNRKDKNSEPAVISANIDLSGCLDMLDIGCWPFVDLAWKKVAELHAKEGKPAPQQIGPLEAFSYAALAALVDQSRQAEEAVCIQTEILKAFMPEACAELQRKFQKDGRAMPNQIGITDLEEQIGRRYGNNQRDCAVMNAAIHFLKEFGVPVRTTRAAFMEGSEPYEGSWFRDRSHVQIAVVDARALGRPPSGDPVRMLV